jgi:hypothetical protein
MPAMRCKFIIAQESIAMSLLATQLQNQRIVIVAQVFLTTKGFGTEQIQQELISPRIQNR